MTNLPPLSGDVLIHCGDMFNLFRASTQEVEEMDAWFGRQKIDVVLCTGGNHDLSLEEELEHNPRPFRNAVIGHAFHRDARGMKDAWSLIATETDVLVTHTPPAGVFDVSVVVCSWDADTCQMRSLGSARHCIALVTSMRALVS